MANARRKAVRNIEEGERPFEWHLKEFKYGIKRYYRDKEYQAAMDEFTTFVTIGDNPHDDAVDSITQLEMFVEGNGNKGATVEAVVNPFRMTGGYGYYGY